MKTKEYICLNLRIVVLRWGLFSLKDQSTCKKIFLLFTTKISCTTINPWKKSLGLMKTVPCNSAGSWQRLITAILICKTKWRRVLIFAFFHGQRWHLLCFVVTSQWFTFAFCKYNCSRFSCMSWRPGTTRAMLDRDLHFSLLI